MLLALGGLAAVALREPCVDRGRVEGAADRVEGPHRVRPGVHRLLDVGEPDPDGLLEVHPDARELVRVALVAEEGEAGAQPERRHAGNVRDVVERRLLARERGGRRGPGERAQRGGVAQHHGRAVVGLVGDEGE